ncbi:hypothetical protein BDB01DRAFT_478555 [Pilobolus umbonatus]|nr:hypothetical protein BDB01DRAFT_478555 [Pilobolus umbonatus]
MDTVVDYLYEYRSECAEDIEHYESFKKHIQPSLLKHFTSDTMDYDQLVSIPFKCTCSLPLTYRDLLDMAVQPTINDLVSIVIGSLVNSCMFGDYTLQHIVMMGHPLPIGGHIQSEITRRIKEKMKFHMKYFDLNVIHIDEPISHVIQDGLRSLLAFPETGLLKQLSSGTYSFKIKSSLSAFHDHARSIPYNEQEVHVVLKQSETITPTIREQGFSYLIHFDCSLDSYKHPGFYGYLYFSAGDSMKEVINFYVLWKERSFPFVLRFFPDWDTTQVSVHCNPDGQVITAGQVMAPFYLSENLTLTL